jgi:hypothetical protein
MGKHKIKKSEVLSVFQVFPCTTQIALLWPKLAELPKQKYARRN